MLFSLSDPGEETTSFLGWHICFADDANIGYDHPEFDAFIVFAILTVLL